MKFTISKSDLVHELQTVAGVVEKRSTLPILANLLLEARSDGLHVGASDLEVTVRGVAKADVAKEGSVTLPAGKLHEIARSLPDAEVRFQLQDRNQVSIICERSKFKIPSQPREEFPNFPEVDESKGIKLPGHVLKGMIERIAFAITTEDPRYSLNGALFLLRSGSLTLVATDGHRLAYVSSELDVVAPDGEVKIIVPRKALAEVSKLISDIGEDEHVIFGQSDNQVFFLVGRHRLTSNLLEGDFPRYENVMPESSDTVIELPREGFAQAVRRVSLLSSERLGRAVRLDLSSGKLELSSKTEMGEAQETLPVEYDGDGISIGFNARYLLDFLGVVGSPSISLEMNPARAGDDEAGTVEAGDKPGQFRPVPAGDLEYRYIVMPMHL
jgi:DNA polymerase-3 subunit beta